MHLFQLNVPTLEYLAGPLMYLRYLCWMQQYQPTN